MRSLCYLLLPFTNHCYPLLPIATLCYPLLPDSRKSTPFQKVPTFRAFVLLVRATCRWRRAWSIGGVLLTRKNRNTSRQTCPTATLSTTNLTWTDSETNPGLQGERPATNRLTHGRPIKTRLYLSYIKNSVRNSQSTNTVSTPEAISYCSLEIQQIIGYDC